MQNGAIVGSKRFIGALVWKTSHHSHPIFERIGFLTPLIDVSIDFWDNSG
jgi:hypothetical protein